MKLIIIFFAMCSTCIANEFTKVAPDGSKYDSRMWEFDSYSHRVVVKPEYKDMTELERFRAAGIPHYMDNPKWIAYNERQKERAEEKRQIRIEALKHRQNRSYELVPVIHANFYSYYYNPYIGYPVGSYGTMWSYKWQIKR